MTKTLHRRISALALAFTALVLAGVGLAGPKKIKPWIQVETAHFTVYSDAHPRTASKVARSLEALYLVLSRILPNQSMSSPLPTRVYAFENDKSFKQFMDPEGSRPNVVGLFMEREEANYVAINTRNGQFTNDVVYHEYLHYVLSNNFGSLPTWYEEGMAEYYSTFNITGEDTVAVGTVIWEHVMALRDLIPLDELFAITPLSPDYNEGERQGVFYAQSWALVHYMYTSPGMRPKLAQFLVYLEQGQPAEAASEAAFGKGLDALTNDLREYVDDGKFPYVQIKFNELQLDSETHVEKLEAQETLAILGDLMLHREQGSFVEGEALFRQVLENDSDHAAARRGLGRAQAYRGAWPEAIALYLQALEIDPGDALTHYLLGVARLRLYYQTVASQASGAEAGSGLTEAIASFRRSIELDDSFGPAHGYLGTALFAASDCDGLEVLKRAWQMQPQKLRSAGELTALLAICDRDQESRYLLENVIEPHADEEVVDFVHGVLLDVEIQKAYELARSGKLAEAKDRLESVVQRVENPQRRSRIASDIERMREQLERSEMP